MAPRVLAVIPARLNSSRFPQKVIYPYRGKPLISYVYSEVKKAGNVDRTIVATDNKLVHRALAPLGVDVILTSARHRTGSDRTAEVMDKLGGDIVVNIQADNFGLKAAVLNRVIENMLADTKIRFATLARRIESEDELYNPNVVKVAATTDGRVLWFSRFPIPYVRQTTARDRMNRFPFLRHVGIYFFRKRALERFARWGQSRLEKAESLEQLRILENGEVMHLFRTSMRSVSIDTPQDLKKIDRIYR